MAKLVKFSVALYDNQLEFIDAKCEKENIKRSKFIERHCLPEELWHLGENRGRKKKVLIGGEPKE